MAVFVWMLLISAGVMAQHQPPQALRFRQDGSEIPYRTPSSLARQIGNELNQDRSDLGIGKIQMALKSKVQPSIDDADDALSLTRKISVKTHEENSDNTSDIDSDPGFKEVSFKPKVPSSIKDSESECVFPFISVGNHCYFFSQEQKTFADAEAYCENLSHGHSFEASLAMMDYSRDEDQAFMKEVTDRDTTFFIGGTSQDGINWSWLDYRALSLKAPLWYWGEPNTASNKCLVAQVSSSGNNIRSYLYDSECSETLNFICQTRLPDQFFEFRKIGSDYYFMSEVAGLPPAHWQEARDYCKGLLVPVGYHADMAVLGMEQQDDYTLMNSLFPSDDVNENWAWIGAVSENSDCNYAYIDNRTLPVSSTYWVYHEPGCGGDKFVVLRYYVPYNRVYLYSYPDTSTYAFICQLYKN